MTHILNPLPPPKELQKSRGKKRPQKFFPFLTKTSTTALKFIVNNLHKCLPQTALLWSLHHQEEKAAVIPAHIMLPVQRSPNCLKIVRPRWPTTGLMLALVLQNKPNINKLPKETWGLQSATAARTVDRVSQVRFQSLQPRGLRWVEWSHNSTVVFTLFFHLSSAS